MACISCQQKNAKEVKDLDKVRIRARVTANLIGVNHVIYEAFNTFMGSYYDFEPQVVGGNTGRKIIEVVNVGLRDDQSGVVLQDTKQSGIVADANPRQRKERIVKTAEIDGAAAIGAGGEVV